MKKYAIVIITLLFFTNCQQSEHQYGWKRPGSGSSRAITSSKPGNNNIANGKEAGDNSLITDFQTPSYIGGKQEFINYIKKNIVLPDSVTVNGLKGKVSLSLTINANGDMIKCEVVHSIKHCPDCTKEAIRLINAIPKWRPAYTNEANGTKKPYVERLVVDVDFKKN